MREILFRGKQKRQRRVGLMEVIGNIYDNKEILERKE